MSEGLVPAVGWVMTHNRNPLRADVCRAAITDDSRMNCVPLRIGNENPTLYVGRW